jgi:outer membrane autotransporter protein
VGVGVSWRFAEEQQISLDYGASIGEKYNRPYSLTASYRYRF